ncbi:MAG: family 20 glycosylhydrolase [Clostridia bacterium]|nr:family 20 glycosylhydrolase [Clostridia bacterium]
MPFDDSEVSRLQSMVADVTNLPLPFPIHVSDGQGLTVDWNGADAAIAARDRTALCRGLFLLSRAVKEKKPALHVAETRRFAHCGAMLDMSRNRVMTVEAVKKWLDRQAALGLNLLMLYTEDTYEIPEYPYFGYLRGRYTQAELREIDDYADSLGVELVPCVQTLAHLKNFLQWPASAPLRDQPDILLIDSEETYAFLDAALRSLSQCFRSRRIHIGMDEAHGVGLGNYLLKHGYANRFELLNRHLARVKALCDKYGFKPMMWSDMFFRLGSKNNAYYDLNNHVPDDVIAALPEVEMVYWDYYHTEGTFYERMLDEHRRMGRGTVYAGGVWSWSGFLPNRERTVRTMEPALRISARMGLDTVFATLWGDDGAETDYLMAVDRLTLFSEACWTGEGFRLDECEAAAECLTGLSAAVRSAFDAFYADDYTRSTGKTLIWCDPLYPCGATDEQMQTLYDAAEKAVRTLEASTSRLEIRYAVTLFTALRKKIALIRGIRNAWVSQDRQALKRITAEDCPDSMKAYEDLMNIHRSLWESASKRQGWEVLALRYGGAVGRLGDVRDEIERWLNGSLSRIPELDEPALPDGKGFTYDRTSTPSAKT